LEVIAMGATAYRSAKVSVLPRELWPSAAYAGILQLLGRAGRAIARRDHQDAHNALVLAQHVVLALKASLQPAGGEISVHLAALYDYMAAELGQSNIDKDRERLDRLVQVIAPLRDAWEAAGREALQGVAAAGER
jgi:flagellar protein FliS